MPRHPIAHDAWRHVSALLDELLDLPESQREGYLAQLSCDASTRNDLRQLLVAASASKNFLEHQPVVRSLEPAANLLSGKIIGKYRIDGLIARGGMGDVYRAERADGHFEQPVAFKLAREATTLSAQLFQKERQILANLEHPGIARLIDGGLTDDGLPYMTMELVDGVDVLSFCNQHSLDLASRLALFGQICSAVAYAHRHLIVHRDLKPSNILVGKDGHAKLLDFGIAKLLDPEKSGTDQPTMALMTPEYAAPEQLEGKSLTTATDVYALGVLLFHMLSGRAPWNVRDLPLPAALQRLLQQSHPALSDAVADNPERPVSAKLLRGDLDAIVAKALRREPESRYSSALEFWQDIQAHLAFRPVVARSDVRGYVGRRFFRRNRLWIGAAATVLAALLIGLAGTLWQANVAKVKARQAERDRDRALAESARVQSILDYLDLMLSGAQEQGGIQAARAKEMLDASADQLIRRFADAPVEKARSMAVLADLYLTLYSFDGAASILTTFLSSPDAEADPQAKAKIQFDLAQIEFKRGNVEKARALVQGAQNFWNGDDDRYRGELIHSRSMQSQLQAAKGDVDGAIRVLREALSASMTFNGDIGDDTITLEGDLGAALLKNNQLDEADELMTRAWTAIQAAGRTKSQDGITLLHNLGVNAIYKNDLARAETIFRQIIDIQRQAFGSSTALATSQNDLAEVLVRSGRASEALPLLADARAMLQKFTGDDSSDTLSTFQTEAEARILLRDMNAAEPLVHIVVAGMLKQFGSRSPLYANALGLEARLRFLQGRTSESAALVEQAGGILKDAGEAGPFFLPQLHRLEEDLRNAKR
jgi:eukaryotic-like serine/threonine-protein kinase